MYLTPDSICDTYCVLGCQDGYDSIEKADDVVVVDGFGSTTCFDFFYDYDGTRPSNECYALDAQFRSDCCTVSAAVTSAPATTVINEPSPTDTPVAVPAPTATPVAAPTEAPVIPTEAPVIPTEAPVVPTEAPVVPTEAPVVLTSAPVEPVPVTPAPVAEPVVVIVDEPVKAPKISGGKTPKMAKNTSDGTGTMISGGKKGSKRRTAL